MTNTVAKRVLITGASRGIGRALVELYLRRGADVLAVARDIASDGWPGPGRLQPVVADLTAAAGWQTVVDAARRLDQPVDILVNNAGLQNAIDLPAVDPQAFLALAEREMALNLMAPLVLTQALLPVMRRPGGTIVNVTSLVSRHAKPSAPVYSASKAGLQAFTDALRHQLASAGITVVEAVPPLVDTAMTAGRGNGKMSAEAMASAIAAGVERGRPRVAPGLSQAVLMLDRVAPKCVERLMQKA